MMTDRPWSPAAAPSRLPAAIASAAPASGDEQLTLRQWLGCGPFSLTMSSGFFGFFAHAGMLDALEQDGLRPHALSGSSAGALIAGLWAAGLDARVICKELSALRRSDFWDPGPGAGLLRGQRFVRQLQRLLPVQTFAACRARLAISVFDLLGMTARVLDSGPLAPAIHASCAVPLLFQPAWIEGRLLLDGGIADRPGLRGMPDRGQRLLFHHLQARSPWRLRPPPLPSRCRMVTLLLGELPRVGPLHLDRGPAAIDQARATTRTMLDRPLRCSHDGSAVARAHPALDLGWQARGHRAGPTSGRSSDTAHRC